MEELNERIKFARGNPNKEMHEHMFRESMTRLAMFRATRDATEATLVSQGISEVEIESWRHSTTNEYIQLLEAVLRAKRRLSWFDKDLHQLMDEKITILEKQIQIYCNE